MAKSFAAIGGAGGLNAALISWRRSSSIGVIGGADGPTAIFVASKAASPLWGVALAVAAVLLLGWLRRRRGK